ncbi:MAG TPA: 4-(cytidine 5'-diphospho)-2-C-methyl-D-erythritol kinase [Thermoanaerobacterales bacterium]|nr:4-(cytidine 5'-diphospho)-2-C-methyl-D-erythritol kinase [Thermoanaerobacterales bacterium]
MNKICMDARAKINLTLDVLYKRPDNYHEVEMIMQSIALKDELILELIPKRDIELESNVPWLMANEDNLAFKAAKLMLDKYKLDAGLKIKLKKNIPIAAGLAGGSTDAAAVILGINELFDLKRPKKELMASGKTLGADVPFCIQGGTAIARGIGEKIIPLKPLSDIALVLVKPPYSISTKEVYSRLDVKNIKNRPSTMEMVKNIQNQDLDSISKGLCNVLEQVTLRMYPELEEIRNELLNLGALGSLMSGSGPTVFGIFETKQDAKKAAKKLSFEQSLVYVTEVN